MEDWEPAILLILPWLSSLSLTYFPAVLKSLLNSELVKIIRDTNQIEFLRRKLQMPAWSVFLRSYRTQSKVSNREYSLKITFCWNKESDIIAWLWAIQTFARASGTPSDRFQSSKTAQYSQPELSVLSLYILLLWLKLSAKQSRALPTLGAIGRIETSPFVNSEARARDSFGESS